MEVGEQSEGGGGWSCELHQDSTTVPLQTYLCDELSHELHHGGIIAKLPQKHHDFFHLNTILSVTSKHVIDETMIMERGWGRRRE